MCSSVSSLAFFPCSSTNLFPHSNRVRHDFLRAEKHVENLLSSRRSLDTGYIFCCYYLHKNELSGLLKLSVFLRYTRTRERGCGFRNRTQVICVALADYSYFSRPLFLGFFIQRFPLLRERIMDVCSSRASFGRYRTAGSRGTRQMALIFFLISLRNAEKARTQKINPAVWNYFTSSCSFVACVSIGETGRTSHSNSHAK